MKGKKFHGLDGKKEPIVKMLITYENGPKFSENRISEKISKATTQRGIVSHNYEIQAAQYRNIKGI